jgi:hypothetical protein
MKPLQLVQWDLMHQRNLLDQQLMKPLQLVQWDLLRLTRL